MTILRRSKVVASSLLAAASLVVSSIGSPPVAAAATCAASPSDSNCTGKWPDQQGCWGRDAYVAAASNWTDSRTGARMQTQVWWSPTCRTNWGQVYSLDHSRQFLEVDVTRVEPMIIEMAAPVLLQSAQLWSPMVYAPNTKAWACGWDVDHQITTNCTSAV